MLRKFACSPDPKASSSQSTDRVRPALRHLIQLLDARAGAEDAGLVEKQSQERSTSHHPGEPSEKSRVTDLRRRLLWVPQIAIRFRRGAESVQLFELLFCSFDYLLCRAPTFSLHDHTRTTTAPHHSEPRSCSLKHESCRPCILQVLEPQPCKVPAH